MLNRPAGGISLPPPPPSEAFDATGPLPPQAAATAARTIPTTERRDMAPPNERVHTCTWGDSWDADGWPQREKILRGVPAPDRLEEPRRSCDRGLRAQSSAASS